MLRRLAVKCFRVGVVSAVVAVSVVWWASYRDVVGVQHVYTRQPGAVGHYVPFEDGQMWVAPGTATTEWCVAGGYLFRDHPYIDGAVPGWRRQSDPFTGFKGPLPTNRLGFHYEPGGDTIVPMWAVLTVVVLAAGIVNGVPLARSRRRRPGFPAISELRRAATGRQRPPSGEARRD